VEKIQKTKITNKIGEKEMYFDEKINKNLKEILKNKFQKLYPEKELNELKFQLSKDNSKELQISSPNLRIEQITNENISEIEKAINGRFNNIVIINNKVQISYLLN
jgi:hypothetical protein